MDDQHLPLAVLGLVAVLAIASLFIIATASTPLDTSTNTQGHRLDHAMTRENIVGRALFFEPNLFDPRNRIWDPESKCACLAYHPDDYCGNSAAGCTKYYDHILGYFCLGECLGEDCRSECTILPG